MFLFWLIFWAEPLLKNDVLLNKKIDRCVVELDLLAKGETIEDFYIDENDLGVWDK